MFVRPKPKLGTLCIYTSFIPLDNISDSGRTQEIMSRPVHIIAELQQGRFNRGGRYLRKFVTLWCFTSVLGILVDKALLKKLFIGSQLHVFFC